MKELCIAMTGMPQTGKTTIAKLLCKKYSGYREVDLGEPVALLASALTEVEHFDKQDELPPWGTYRALMGRLYKAMAEEYGNHWPIVLEADKQFEASSVPVYTNVYYNDSMAYLQKQYKKVLKVYVYSTRREKQKCSYRDLAWVLDNLDSFLIVRSDDLDFEAYADMLHRAVDNCQNNRL